MKSACMFRRSFRDRIAAVRYALDTMGLRAATKKKLRQLGPTGLLALMWTAAPALMGLVLLWQIGAVSDLLMGLGALGVVLYVSVFILSGGAGLLPTYSQAIVAGWVFGVAIGIPAALAGYVGAALLGYAIARFVSRDSVENVIESNAKATVIRNTLIGKGPWRTLGIVTLLRVPPNSPFALTNLVMASTGVSIIPYVVGTAVGMLPRTGVAIVLAAAASREARDIQEFVSEGPGPYYLIGGLAVMFIVLGIIGFIANRAIEKLESGRNAQTSETPDPPVE